MKSCKAGRNLKPETQNCYQAGLSFEFRASGFFRISDTDFVACSRFIGVSTFGFMLPQRLARLFSAALPVRSDRWIFVRQTAE
jgi:hypothetical protein